MTKRWSLIRKVEDSPLSWGSLAVDESGFMISQLVFPSGSTMACNRVFSTDTLDTSYPSSPKSENRLIAAVTSPAFTNVSFSNSPVPFSQKSFRVTEALGKLRNKLISRLLKSKWPLSILLPSDFTIPSILPRKAKGRRNISIRMTPMTIAVILNPFFIIALVVRFIVITKLVIKDKKSKVIGDYVLLYSPLLIGRIHLITNYAD